MKWSFITVHLLHMKDLLPAPVLLPTSKKNSIVFQVCLEQNLPVKHYVNSKQSSFHSLIVHCNCIEKVAGSLWKHHDWFPCQPCHLPYHAVALLQGHSPFLGPHCIIFFLTVFLGHCVALPIAGCLGTWRINEKMNKWFGRMTAVKKMKHQALSRSFSKCWEWFSFGKLHFQIMTLCVPPCHCEVCTPGQSKGKEV